MLKTIRLYAKEVKKQDGSKFVKWSYTKDGNKFYEVHFTKECPIPQKRGYYQAVVKTEDVNIKKSKAITKVLETGEVVTTQPNDKLWIKALQSITPDIEYEKEVEKKRIEALDELL